jgi:hypothetical protein
MGGLQDLVALIRADTPLIVVETADEARTVDLFRQALRQVWRAMFRWSVTEGLRRFDLDREDPAGVAGDPAATLRAIHGAHQRGVYLLLDLDHHLDDPATQRLLRDLIERRGCASHVLVLVGARVELPPELDGFALRFRPRLPDLPTLQRLVREQADAYAREHAGRHAHADAAAMERIARNLQGLQESDARRLVRQLVFADGALDDADLPRLAKLKFELLNRSGHLHYEYDTARFAEVAGAARAKRWIEQRRAAFIGDPPPGLDPPKGMLLLGVQGCGKSMLAKAVAGGFGVPLLRLDFGALYNKYHGETEKNLRDALASAEQLAPCVLWIDEIEKALAGGGGEDGGVSRRVLGTFLTWLAERSTRVFVVATANQVQDLPPELLRKGRFDEIFFVDLPSAEARGQILATHLRRRGADPAGFDLPALAQASEGFSGAEIEQAIVAALYAAHAQGAALGNFQLRAELRQARPLSVLMHEQVQALRDWARERTVPAD